ncbi:hypothetical protein SAMN05660642_03067, partial [Geodermatophilus siccatus]
HSGRLDHIALYRPGLGTFWILRNTGGAFTPVYAEGSPGHGIDGYDLADERDQAFAVDYDGSGKPDHVVLYRPGAGVCWILRQSAPTMFTPVVRSRQQTQTLYQPLSEVKGWVQVQLSRDGAVRFSGHVHNDPLISEAFDFQVRVQIGTVQAIVLQHSGHCGGLGAGPEARNDWWDEQDVRFEVLRHFDAIVADSNLQVQESRTGSITGPLADIGEFVLGWALGAVAINPLTGLLIFVGGELVGLALSGDLVPVSRIIGGTLWLKGPYGTLYALAAEGIAAIGSNSRQLTQQEYDWADAEVFQGTLPPIDKIVLTDTITRIDNTERAFVFPRFDGKFTLNFGPAGFANPMGQPRTFIHELTHTWQLEHTQLGLAWLAEALATQVCAALGQDVYHVGPPGPPFSDFNLEQQAEIVARWWSGGKSTSDPYYRYIASNIRLASP